MELKNKNFLITGGFGHLGGALGFQLSEENEVIVPATQQVHNVPFIIHNCDLQDYNKLREIVIREDIDFIVHLAGLKTMALREKDIRKTLENNYLCTLNVLEILKEGLVKGAIIGTGNNELVKYYTDNFKVPIVIADICDIYGPGDVNPYHAFPKIYRRKLRGIKTTAKEFNNNPKQWIFISDAVDGIKILIENFEKAKGKTFKIMDTKVFSDRDIYNFITGKDTKKKQFITKDNYGFYGWKPKISLQEGLDQCSFWYSRVFTKQ